jgi:hypothetical protein
VNLPSIAKARALLGKQVVVTLGPATIVEGRLLGFAEDGDFEVLGDDGVVHYCWPMLDIEDRLEAEARGTIKDVTSTDLSHLT